MMKHIEKLKAGKRSYVTKMNRARQIQELARSYGMNVWIERGFDTPHILKVS